MSFSALLAENCRYPPIWWAMGVHSHHYDLWEEIDLDLEGEIEDAVREAFRGI